MELVFYFAYGHGYKSELGFGLIWNLVFPFYGLTVLGELMAQIWGCSGILIITTWIEYCDDTREQRAKGIIRDVRHRYEAVVDSGMGCIWLASCIIDIATM